MLRYYLLALAAECYGVLLGATALRRVARCCWMLLAYSAIALHRYLIATFPLFCRSDVAFHSLAHAQQPIFEPQ